MRRKASILDVLRAAQSEPAKGKKSRAAANRSKIHRDGLPRDTARKASLAERVLALKTWFSAELSMPRGGFYVGVLLSLGLFFAAFELGKKRGQHAAEARQSDLNTPPVSGNNDLVVNSGAAKRGGSPLGAGRASINEELASDRKTNASVLADNPSGTGTRQGDRGLAREKREGRDKHDGPWLQILSREDNAAGKIAIQAVIDHLSSLGYRGATIYRTKSSRGLRHHITLCLPIKDGKSASTLTRELRQLPKLKTRQVTLDFRNLSTVPRAKLGS